MTNRIVIVGAGCTPFMVALLLEEMQHQGDEVVIVNPDELQGCKHSRLGELLSGASMAPPPELLMERRREKAQWKRERAGRRYP